MPSFLVVNPRYQQMLTGSGLLAAEDFLALKGVIVNAHPERNVARVCLDGGRMQAFLKKERRVRWRDRLTSALAGFGWASKSLREMRLLEKLNHIGIGEPEVIAAGEAGGQAFLLLRAKEDGVELRIFLQQASAGERRQLARQLGALLGFIHGHGFDHPDLLAKHVLVARQATSGPWRCCLLDWQRSRRRSSLSLGRRCRDLANLDATLTDDWLPLRDRLALLTAYQKTFQQVQAAKTSSLRPASSDLRQLAEVIRRHSGRLLGKRRIRELRQPPLPPESQTLIPLDGEALCVTRECQQEFAGQLPVWLLSATAGRSRLERRSVSLPSGRRGQLIRRCRNSWWEWLWALLTGRPRISPELEQAGAFYRLQRYGLVQARLLAVGQRFRWPWRSQSFLLTELPPDSIPLARWLQEEVSGRRRRLALRSLGGLLRRLHYAGFLLAGAGERLAELLVINDAEDAGCQVALQGVEGIRRARLTSPTVVRDLVLVCQQFGLDRSRTDCIRCLRGYLNQPYPGPTAHHLARRLFAALQKNGVVLQ